MNYDFLNLISLLLVLSTVVYTIYTLIYTSSLFTCGSNKEVYFTTSLQGDNLASYDELNIAWAKGFRSSKSGKILNDDNCYIVDENGITKSNPCEGFYIYNVTC